MRKRSFKITDTFKLATGEAAIERVVMTPQLRAILHSLADQLSCPIVKSKPKVTKKELRNLAQEYCKNGLSDPERRWLALKLFSLPEVSEARVDEIMLSKFLETHPEYKTLPSHRPLLSSETLRLGARIGQVLIEVINLAAPKLEKLYRAKQENSSND